MRVPFSHVGELARGLSAAARDCLAKAGDAPFKARWRRTAVKRSIKRGADVEAASFHVGDPEQNAAGLTRKRALATSC